MDVMELHGTIIDNLRAAVASAQRLRQRPVYPDTILYWRELLADARRQLRGGEELASRTVEELIAALELELADRPD